MTTINFPADPEVGQEYSYGPYVWSWNGRAWQAVTLLSIAAEPYVPANEANWDSIPTTVGEALDIIASRLKALEG